MRRRDFLHAGSAGMLGLGLTDFLSLKAQGGVHKDKSDMNVIMLFLVGGPSQLDTFDMKPDAPSEIRGPYKPIKTNVPGIEICELFPRMAKMMDKFIPIRTIVGSTGGHDGYQCMIGRSKSNAPPGGWPAAGAWVSKIKGNVNAGVPPHLSMMYATGNRTWGEPGTCIGCSTHHAFRPPAETRNPLGCKSIDDRVVSGTAE